MKLHLSSFRLATTRSGWLRCCPPSARVAVVCNAIDAEDPAVRREKVADEIDWLTELGLRPEELDLRSYVTTSRAWTCAPAPQYDGLWVARRQRLRASSRPGRAAEPNISCRT